MMVASIINTDFIRTHSAQAVLTVLGLSGAVLIFLPFVEHDNKDLVAAVVFIEELPPPLPPFFLDFFWLLAPFVLLPFAISAGYLRWLLTGHLSRGEAVAGYAFALLFACSLVLVEVWDALLTLDWPHGYVYFLVAFVTGAGFLVLNLHRAIPSVPNALVAMQVVYLPPALVLIAFGDQIGWYLAIVTVLAYSAQIVMAAKRPRQALIFFVPLVVVWGLLMWES